jgi:hypothetical protein
MIAQEEEVEPIVQVERMVQEIREMDEIEGIITDPWEIRNAFINDQLAKLEEVAEKRRKGIETIAERNNVRIEEIKEIS